MAAANREQLLSSRSHLLAGLLLAALGIGGCSGIGVIRAGGWAVLIMVLLSVFPILVVTCAGLIPLVWTRRHLRRATYWAWVRATLPVHVSWLAAIPVGCGAAAVAHALESDHDAGPVVLGTAVVLLVIINALVGWWTISRLLSQWRELGLSEFGLGRWVALLVFCNIGGLMMSVIAAYVAAMWCMLLIYGFS